MKVTSWALALGATAAVATGSPTRPCRAVETKFGRVCECTAEYCDTVPSAPIDLETSQEAVIFTTSKAGARLSEQRVPIQVISSTGNYAITLDLSTSFQKILGFGGAFTDAGILCVLL